MCARLGRDKKKKKLFTSLVNSYPGRGDKGLVTGWLSLQKPQIYLQIHPAIHQ